MRVLGIETSCDETAAAVVEDGRQVRSNVVFSQVRHHRPYGGVVPELASRCHVEVLPGVLGDAVRSAGLGWPELDALAVTGGPGLASALLVGVVAAKALGLALGRPLLRVHHLEAHLYSIFLGDGAPEPAAAAGAVALLVSGGHTCLVRLEAPGRYRMLGRTLDDAAGEALDKGANLLRLGYPGGPAIERAAAGGRDDFVRFPRGAVAAAVDGLRPEFCFSFSGLKTALLHYLRERPSAFEDGTRRDVAASYEEAVVDALAQRVERALDAFRPPLVACAGGVARNRRLRERLAALAAAHGVPLRLAAPEYCTDNAAMVAAAAGAGLGRAVAEPADLDVEPSSPLA